MNGWLTRDEIEKIGFKSVGEDVQISDKACFYGASKMSIGNHVRIDDFCIFIGTITLGDYIHIAPQVGLHASLGSITLGNYSGISSGAKIYAAGDDYSGETMTNPMVPSEFVHTVYTDIIVGNHALVGLNSVLLPGSCVPEGAAVGAMTLVHNKLKPWGIYSGVPAKKIGIRSKKCLEYEEKLKGQQGLEH